MESLPYQRAVWKLSKWLSRRMYPVFKSFLFHVHFSRFKDRTQVHLDNFIFPLVREQGVCFQCGVLFFLQAVELEEGEKERREKERMETMADYLVGFRNFKSKKNGKDYTVAHVVSEASNAEKQRGYVGNKVEEVFLPEDLVGSLNESHISKAVEREYQVSGGRAYLVDFKVVDKK